jgi:hypothetical protein
MPAKHDDWGEYAQHMQQLHTCISRLMEGIYTQQTFFTHTFHICLTTNMPTNHLS